MEQRISSRAPNFTDRRSLLPIWSIGLFAIGCGVLGWAWFWHRPAPEQAPAAQSDATLELVQLKAQTAAMRAELEHLRAELHARPAEVATVQEAAARTGEPSVEPGSEQRIVDPTPEQEQRSELRYRAFLDTKVLQDAPDETPGETQKFSAALQRVLPAGSTLSDFVCRKSLCRVQTSHRDLAGYQAFQAAGFGSAAEPIWNGSTTFMILHEPGASEPLTAVMYLARGGALPEQLPEQLHAQAP